MVLIIINFYHSDEILATCQVLANIQGFRANNVVTPRDDGGHPKGQRWSPQGATVVTPRDNGGHPKGRRWSPQGTTVVTPWGDRIDRNFYKRSFNLAILCYIILARSGSLTHTELGEVDGLYPKNFGVCYIWPIAKMVCEQNSFC